MIRTRKLAASALAAFLLVGGTGAAFSQTPAPAPVTPAPAVEREDDGFDWGWLGLLGLIGLAGLMRRDRTHDVHHRPGVGTTTTTR